MIGEIKEEVEKISHRLTDIEKDLEKKQ